MAISYSTAGPTIVTDDDYIIAVSKSMIANGDDEWNNTIGGAAPIAVPTIVAKKLGIQKYKDGDLDEKTGIYTKIQYTEDYILFYYIGLASTEFGNPGETWTITTGATVIQKYVRVSDFTIVDEADLYA